MYIIYIYSLVNPLLFLCRLRRTLCGRCRPAYRAQTRRVLSASSRTSRSRCRHSATTTGEAGSWATHIYDNWRGGVLDYTLLREDTLARRPRVYTRGARFCFLMNIEEHVRTHRIYIYIYISASDRKSVV